MRALVLSCLLALLATACGGSADPLGDGVGDGTSADAQAGPFGDWVLDASEPAIEVPDDARVTMTVATRDDGATAVGGTAACNSYGGEAVFDGDGSGRFTATELAQTEMGCEPPLMDAEAAFLGALTQVTAWERTSSDELVLSGPGVELRFALLAPVEPASFTGTTWAVDGYITGTGEEAAISSRPAGVEPATLRLDDDGTFVLFSGCRDFAGAWVASGDEIQFTSWGQTDDSRGVDGAGDLTCGADAEAQERDVLDVVEGGFTAEVDGQRLTLTNGGVGLSAMPDEVA